MKLNVAKNYSEARWFEMEEGVRFFIRPYPASREKLLVGPGGTLAISGEQQLDKFNYCLCGWEGIEDDSGKALECTEKIKRTVFDNRLGGIPEFVAKKINELDEEREADLKN